MKNTNTTQTDKRFNIWFKLSPQNFAFHFLEMKTIRFRQDAFVNQKQMSHLKIIRAHNRNMSIIKKKYTLFKKK